MSLVRTSPVVPLLERLRVRWTAAVVVGELVGFLPLAIVGVALVSLGAADPLLVIGLTAAGALEGAAIGTTQSRVLSGYWPGLVRRDWIVATATAASLAWFVGMGGSALAGLDRVPVALAVAVVVPCSVLALGSMGYLQWRVLRPLVPASIRWVPVTAGAWLVGVLVPVIALSVVPDRWPPAGHVAVAVLAAAAMGVIVGTITGRTLEQFAADGLGSTASSIDSASLDRRIERVEERFVLAVKFLWTVVTCFVVESLIFGLAALPTVLFFQWHLGFDLGPRPLRLFLLAAALVPAYIIFALLFMLLSAEAARLLGWRPPQSAELAIAELPIGLRDWARYAIMSHLVHVLVGVMFRSTPVWVWYMRRNGATIGKHVWINSLQVGDDCLLDFGDEVVIGAGVHLSAHTVEDGVLRLAPVRLGRGTTVGVGSHVGIGVTTGERTQIGSMSVVPKHAVLEGHRTYVGIPARPIGPPGDEQWARP